MFNSIINPIPFHKQFFGEIIRLHWGSILLHRHVSDSNTREDHSRYKQMDSHHLRIVPRRSAAKQTHLHLKNTHALLVVLGQNLWYCQEAVRYPFGGTITPISEIHMVKRLLRVISIFLLTNFPNCYLSNVLLSTHFFLSRIQFGGTYLFFWPFLYFSCWKIAHHMF